MTDPLATTPISPLRQRLIDDMNVRRFAPVTQRNYIRDVGRFATFLGRSPDTATAEDLHRFQVEQREAGVPMPTMNSIVSALRFFFTHTLDRPDLARKLVRVMHPKGWLFPGMHAGKPISTRQLHRIVVEAARAADIAKRVGPHTLRHSFATHLLEDGVGIRVIQALLGHAKLDTTAFYTKVATRTVRAVTSPFDKLGIFAAGPTAPNG